MQGKAVVIVAGSVAVLGLVALFTLSALFPSRGASAVQRAPAANVDRGEASIDCDHVGKVAGQMIDARRTGATEDDAIASLRTAGEYRLGFVVDAIYRAEADAPRALLILDIDAACKRLRDTGNLY